MEWRRIAEWTARLQREPAKDQPDYSMVLSKVQLANEYAEGIGVLLEVSRQYGTAVPDAAAKNLRYLRRLLGEAEAAISAGSRASPCDTSKLSG